jgi:hypothetical protein
MTLTSLTLPRIEDVDGEDAAAVDTPSLDDWRRLICGPQPGVSSPRCTTVPIRALSAAQVLWLHTLWGFA